MHQDSFKTKAATKDFRDGWNRIFGKKLKESKYTPCQKALHDKELEEVGPMMKPCKE